MRFITVLITALFMITACSAYEAPKIDLSVPEAMAYDPENAFQPSEDFMTEIDATMARAKAEGKLALIVMGANWCHDTRAFVKFFNDKDMRQMFDEKYEVLLIDVGFLDHGEDVIRRFGMPVIYGTPTVLVVHPDQELLINRNDMHRWRDSYLIKKKEVLEYFTQMAKPEAYAAAMKSQQDIPPELAALYAEIDAFEEEQAKRIYGGFEVLSPLLAMDRGDRPEETDRYWKQVRDLRYQITDDLERLRKEAKARVEKGETDIKLTFPEYEPFEWE